MSIVSSTITSTTAQILGRSDVRESHIDHLGVEHTRYYLADSGFDAASALAAYAVQLVENLKQGEIAQNVSQVQTNGSLAVITTNHSTNAQNLAALRLAYQSATDRQAIMIGDFLSSLTDTQLQNIFSKTAGQVTTLRTNRLTPASNSAIAIRTNIGE